MIGMNVRSVAGNTLFLWHTAPKLNSVAHFDRRRSDHHCGILISSAILKFNKTR